MIEWSNTFGAYFGDRLHRDHPLGALTTYKVGGPAAWLIEVNSRDDLTVIFDEVNTTGVEVFVIGRGSNVLVSDAGFEGLVLRLGAGFETIELPELEDRSPGDEVIVGAGGAVALPVLARRLAAHGIEGFEWGVGIPGSIGGAVKMNAGGHGSDMAAVLVDAEVFDLDQGQMVTIDGDDLGLRFRGSALARSAVVVGVRLRLSVGESSRSQARLSEIVRWRREHQPGGQNCGSVFVNPEPGRVAAGALIDQIGLKGYRYRSAQVSPKHANFIQASEGGSADDVKALMDQVRAQVAGQTGYLLRSEVRLVGFEGIDPWSFDDPEVAR